MAEILLRIVSFVNPDPAEDLRASWKQGHVIDVREDGAVWGAKESIEVWLAAGNLLSNWHGNTAIVKIPGTLKSEVDYALQSLYDTLPSGATILARRRSWRVNWSKIPTLIRNAILRDFVVTITKTQWDAAMEYVGL